MPKTSHKMDVAGATVALQPSDSGTAMYSFAPGVRETEIRETEIRETEIRETEGKGFAAALPTTAALPALLAQFQARYPAASLVAELLMIHEGNYVVRALVQTEGVAIASSMAAAADIERAEDRAKVRVLELMLPSSSGSQSLVASAVVEQQTRFIANSALEIAPERASPSLSAIDLPATDLSATDLPATDLPATDLPATEQEFVPRSGDRWSLPLSSDETTLNAFSPEVENIAEQPQASTAPALTNPELTQRSDPDSLNSTPPSTASTAAIDLSDAIAQTTVELKRLGWSNAKGRNHLEQAYGKRSRQQLTDTELLDFLHYLELQPSPHQSPF